MNDKLLLEVSGSKNTQIIKKAIYETFNGYNKDTDPAYLYLKELDTIDISTLTVPLCRAYIKMLIDNDDKTFKNTSIENGTIHKILRRMKVIYDINFLYSNKQNMNVFFDVMDMHGWYDRDYSLKLKYKSIQKPINPDLELMHLEDADFSYLCSLLTMLIREGNGYDNPWNTKRVVSGALDKILTKMIFFILNGNYFDVEEDLDE